MALQIAGGENKRAGSPPGEQRRLAAVRLSGLSRHNIVPLIQRAVPVEILRDSVDEFPGNAGSGFRKTVPVERFNRYEMQRSEPVRVIPPVITPGVIRFTCGKPVVAFELTLDRAQRGLRLLRRSDSAPERKQRRARKDL